MSEPKLISPMLDNFDMGGSISDHDGVRCCPAMRKNSDEKYIVKIISVPASQTKMDALLLTGAYPDKRSALAYFKGLANGIVDEKKILDDLAQLEGFIAYEDCQIVPMDDESGYDVYLLGEYKQTLERLLARSPMTQLAAVNLGLDLCAALSVCRRSGYMCVDLKPSNIFVVGDKEYRIGDLGFVKLNSLKYASLPDMYRSCYTAPEVEDAFAALNDTIDIYAAGLILYKVFNGNVLPFEGKYAPNEKFEAPACADEEMAAIILKACDPDPSERWKDPVQMGQAIVSYMQKNGVNDTPLVAESIVATEEPIEPPAVEEASEPAELTNSEDVAAIEPILPISEEDILADESSDSKDIQPEREVFEAHIPETEHGNADNDTLSLVDEITAAVNAEVLSPDLSLVEDVSRTEVVDDDEIVAASEADSITKSEKEEPIQEVSEELEYDNLSFLDDLDEEVANVLADMGDDYEGVTDEISEILDQIDSLTAHQVPDPVVAPEPVEIKIPDPIPTEEPTQVIDVSNADNSTVSEETDETAVGNENEEIPEEELPYIPKKKRTGLIICVVLAILAALAAGCYFFYTLYYLQPIHTFNVSGYEDTLQVELTADVDESLLSVVCADSHGNKVSAPVVGGKAVFSGLTADTAYTVSVEIEGFHELTGTTSKVYSTPVQTKIAQMSVITGSENGSVILSFAVEGPDSEQWNVIYNAEGEAERVTAFPSHMVTLTGLTVGKEYTFRVDPIDDIYLVDETEVTYIAKNLVCAENLHVTACVDGMLSAEWDTPEGETVSEWTVRCYNETGYDETVTTSENTITFENVDDSVVNNVEVTAADMSVNQRVLVSANSVTVSDFSVDTSRSDILSLTWSTNREIPAGGWTIRYTVNGISASTPITSTENAAQIPVVPNGNYVFTILDSSGNAVLGGPFTHTQADAAAFEAYSVNQSNITARLCKTPAASSWSYVDLEDEDYTNTFSTGQKVSMVLALSGDPDESSDSVLTTFTIYDENGNLVSFTHDYLSWQSMWYQNYCELDISGIPADIGTYNVVVYFNGLEAGSQKFEITA